MGTQTRPCDLPNRKVYPKKCTSQTIIMPYKWSTNNRVAEKPTSSDFTYNLQLGLAARESGH